MIASWWQSNEKTDVVRKKWPIRYPMQIVMPIMRKPEARRNKRQKIWQAICVWIRGQWRGKFWTTQELWRHYFWAGSIVNRWLNSHGQAASSDAFFKRPLPKKFHIDNETLRHFTNNDCRKVYGPLRELNPGPPAPEAGIIPLDQADTFSSRKKIL